MDGELETQENLGQVGTGPGDGSRAVAIGGGHGLYRCLQGLSHLVDHVTAVVTTADDGGSSGRLREELGVVPPGDLRQALAALSPRRALARLVQYRFGDGDLAPHTLGNLLIVAAIDLHGGDVVAALDHVATILDVRGRVLPCTVEGVRMCAEADSGEVTGQAEVARTPHLRRVWLEPQDPEATPAAVRAIVGADLVVLGPGSLYTSLVPHLLVPGIREAVKRTRAPVVHVANLREELGETEGLDLPTHLETLLDYGDGLELDAIIAHEGPEPPGAGAPLEADETVLRRYADEVLVADILDPRGGHAPRKLAVQLGRVLRPGRAAFG